MNPKRLILALLIAAAPAAAQEPALARVELPDGLPADLRSRVLAAFDDPASTRLASPAAVPAGDVVEGTVVVRGGDVEVAGRIEGELYVVNGDVSFPPGGEVTGDVVVVGGQVSGVAAGSIGGTLLVYGEGFGHSGRRDDDWSDDDEGWHDYDLDDDDGDDEDPDDWRDHREWCCTWNERRDGASLALRLGPSYNRVEGLPVHVGPSIRTAGSNPLRLEALAILRTAGGDGLEADRLGYSARLEQFLGGRQALRVGILARSEITAIDGWELSPLENSLSTLLLHEDHDDYFEREGWGVYARITPPRLPVDATIGFRDESHATVAVGDPWTLAGDDPWRAQPLVAEGGMRSVHATLRTGGSARGDRPTFGWRVAAGVERAVDGTLVLAGDTELQPPAGLGAATLPPDTFDASFTSGFLDVRTYHRVASDSRLGLRAVLAGSPTDRRLPPQFQRALGGPGSLPAFDRFAVDCGARGALVGTPVDADGPAFYPAYGCDRAVLFQADYIGDLHFDIDLGPRSSRRASAGHEDWWDRDLDLDLDLRWVAFADAGQGWTAGDGGGTDWLADAGFGFMVGDLGVFWAVPLTDQTDGANFFVRLGKRF